MWRFSVGAAVIGLVATSSALRIETRSVLNSRVANVHVDYEDHADGPVTFTYGPCDSQSQDEADHLVARSNSDLSTNSRRLVWVLPRDVSSGGCISAWSQNSELLGRSVAQQVHDTSRQKRSPESPHVKRENGSIPMNSSSGIDVWGPWFDGVALLESNSEQDIDVEAAKAKEVAIVGGGMSGLMTYLVLHQAGLKNITILEGSNRLGGRVHTEYLTGGPSDYSYQEMGPMRIPYQLQVGGEAYNISDQQPTIQIVEEINRVNAEAGRSDLHINLIPFIQNSPNGLSYFNGQKLENGLPPTNADVGADPSLGYIPPEIPESAEMLAADVAAALPGDDFVAEIANNMWQAHSDFLKNRGPAGLPGDQWSEFGFMVNYLNASVSDANAVSGGSDMHMYLERLYYGVLFSPYAVMRTIDGGMSRLPGAFYPLVEDNTKFDSKVERIQWDEDERRLKLSWRGNYTESTLESRDFDYAVISAALPVVQRMRLPSLSYGMTNAINSVIYGSACKVALEYRSRFWEKFDNPIYGSCATTTDIPGIGSVCYPSYNINGTGPATLLASYAVTRPNGVEWAGVPEEQHVQYVVDAMVEIHGEVAREEYTGNFRRKCWINDEFTSGGWAQPSIGMHETYLPEYFKTHKHMIFVGEHTSITHAWISSAVESGLRGAVQLLLELGLVDEAKDAVKKWVARWINV